MNIFILVLYFVLLILFTVFCFIFRRKMISSSVKSKNYLVLNKNYLLAILIIIINIALFVGVIGVFITENNILFMSLDIFVTMLVNFLLIYFLILYPTLGAIVYVPGNEAKLYLLYKSETMEFEFSRIHFERKKNKTNMYYKDSLVLSTKQKIKDIKSIK